MPSMGGLGGMLDRLGGALLPPVSMIQYYSTYIRVPGSVSIHKLRTVPLWYGEPFALMVNPTHGGDGAMPT